MTRPARVTRPALAMLTLIAGCGGSIHGGSSAVERPVGEDLLALLPSGADAVIDVEVAQLDGWPTARRLLTLLPEEGRAQLAQLGDDPLAQIQALAVAVHKAGTPDVGTTMVARGALDWDRLRAALTGAVEGEYHGATIVDGNTESMARITPTVFAFGSRVAVRRVCDVARKDDEGLRTAAVDKALRDALGRAPTAKLGRPAIMAAIVPTPPLREKLRTEKWQSAADLDWAAVSLAIGDGFDVGLIAAAHGPFEADSLTKLMKTRAVELKTQATVRLLGLVPFVEPFIVIAKEKEIHVAYRLTGVRVDQLVTRLEQMQGLGTRKAARP
ncbi:MAG: hypothetical protein JWN44_5303 [Myxococcales bacterium]|nr:hypothetical protein [Myxococcales bacterium]